MTAFIGDVLIIVLTLVIAQASRFNEADARLAAAVPVEYWLVGILIGALWLLALTVWKAWDIRVIGAGALEYQRIFAATLAVFGGVAIVSYALRIELARGYVAIAAPLGLVLLLVWRWLFRRHISRRRSRGELSRRLLIIGGPGEVLQLHRSFARTPGAGYRLIGAVMPGYSLSSPDGEELPVPVLSVDREVSAIMDCIRTHEAEVVAITGHGLKPRTMRALSWELAAQEVSLVLAPALTDIAGPRIHSQPVADLPLIHVSTPRLDGFQAVVKRSFDIAASALGLILISPLLLATAIAIKLDDGGPVFYAQQRVGRDNMPFTMFKFRSMRPDADALLEELRALQDRDAGNGVLFKMRQDPRITRVGSFIRKYSIDELPQLVNVLLGTMSLVGPRPPLANEVEQYNQLAMRRLKVTPGITGLWQINGRSDLDWEESIRLDLYYVENWSFLQDIIIVIRTVKVVLAKDGAY
ncbi:sugar transferase [Brevibacterium album]|uniref:sugar transferase n=1 Tax=Brevibacterium album TaxID=417948 RepID=UPI000416BE6E|nr:sugar transferase [Brevibacterium album]